MMALFLRDLKLSIRAGGGAMIGVLFFMTVVAVIPFGVGPDLNLLARIGRRSSGSARCLPRCSASTACSRRNGTTVPSI